MIYSDILQWSDTLPYWKKKVVSDVLNRIEISDDYIKELYDIFKKEVGLLQDGLDKKLIEMPEDICFTDSDKLVWKKVDKIEGVNRLQSNGEMEIGNSLTLIYGENGSGKSGYTRLFNNVFLSRGDKELIGDIYTQNPKPTYAEFSFEKLDKSKVLVEYPADKLNPLFNKVMVFDAMSARHDMSKESEITFTPQALMIFDEFIQIYNRIQLKLDEECESYQQENPLIKHFKKTSILWGDIENINAKTDVEKLVEKYIISMEEQEGLKAIKEEKLKLMAMNLPIEKSKIKKVKIALRNALEKAEKFNRKLCKQNIQKISKRNMMLEEKSREIELLGTQQFQEYKIEAIGSSEWKDMILSAKKYTDIIQDDTICPLCRQSLKEINIFEKYWAYLKNQSKKEYDLIKKEADDFLECLKGLELCLVEKNSVQEEWLNANLKEEFEKLVKCFKSAEETRNKVIACFYKKDVEGIEVKEMILDEINRVINVVEAIESKMNYKEVEEKINSLNQEENVLEDKARFFDLIPTLEAYLKKLQWLEKAKQNKVTNIQVTKKQKELFDKYVTKQYLENFEEECRTLNAQFDAEIVRRGVKGSVVKRLRIRGEDPGKILSEGEQRAIALANFLTEAQMDKDNIAIILDDPICSLDHKRRAVIVERLLLEARQRQVVIFTHDITFLMELKTNAERMGVDCNQQTMRKVSTIPGNIDKAIPWAGANVKERIKKLNLRLDEIRRVEDSEEYHYSARAWCELLRESWERAVEEILFNDAIQRYNPCIQTKRLEKAPFTHALYKELSIGMSECSNWVHDQARAINGDAPSIDTLDSYMEKFTAFVKGNRAN